MALKGDLKSINLANVLQDLASNELSGTLTILLADHRRDFWFEKGKLRLVGLGLGKHPSPINGLLALGKIKPSDVSTRPNLTVVRGLVKKGAVSDADVKAALEQQMVEFVCDVFAWSEASFEFVQGEADEDLFETSQLDHEIRLAVDPIIMEALRRADEWIEIRKTVFSPAGILVVQPDRAAEGDATIERVAEFFDGERSLQEIIEETHLGDFAVFRAAAAMLRSGAARPLPLKDAQDKAKAAAEGQQHAQALKLARYGLDREPGNIELRRIAAEALEALERADEAASEYRLIAAALAEHDRKEEAAAACRKILALAPRDTFAHERLFSLLTDLRREEEALEEGESLAAACKRAGLPDKAKEVYKRIIEAFGEKDDLLEAAGDLARRLGDKQEAVALYRKLFERSLARGDNDAVIQYARTILRMDPTAEDVSRRRMEVETGVYRRKKRFHRRIKWIAVLSVLAALAAAFATYELKARAFLKQVREDQIGKQDYKAILGRYNQFLDRYGWSLAVPDAQRERNKFEDAYLDQRLPRLPVADDRIIDALAAAEEIRGLVRQKPAQERVEAVSGDLRKQARSLAERFAAEAAAFAQNGTPAALEGLAQMTHPLALEPVRRLAGHASPDVRRAAAKALAGNGSDGAMEALVALVATEQDAGVRDAVIAELKKRTAQDFGADGVRWWEWLKQKEPLKAALTMTGSSLEWRLENRRSTAAEFSFVPEFEVIDWGGQKVSLRGADGGSRRIQLKAGEYVGGRYDLRELGLESPGIYRAAWSARVSWSDAEMRVSTLPITVEVAAPKK